MLFEMRFVNYAIYLQVEDHPTKRDLSRNDMVGVPLFKPKYMKEYSSKLRVYDYDLNKEHGCWLLVVIVLRV